jgi:ABC-type nitrate/sulfonate/bicarbonate transport system substrate-binding protein
MNRRTFLAGLGATGLAFARSRHAAAQAKSVVRLGDILAADLVYVAPALAAEKGFFAEEGLDVKRSVYPNGPAVSQHMASGELDAGMAATFVLLTAKAQGVDLKLVMSLTKDNAPLAVRKDIKTFADLNGKRVGTPGLGTVHDINLNYIEKAHGITVTHVYGKITDLLTYFEKGEIDGLVGWEPVVGEAVYRLGARYLAKSMRPGSESQALAVSGKFVREQPDAVYRLVRAYLKGIRYFEQNFDDSVAVVAKRLQKPPDLVRLAYPQVTVNKPYIERASTREALEIAIEQKKVRKEAVGDPAAFLEQSIDESFLRRAEGSLK